jgi:hypothetical protein
MIVAHLTAGVSCTHENGFKLIPPETDFLEWHGNRIAHDDNVLCEFLRDKSLWCEECESLIATP